MNKSLLIITLIFISASLYAQPTKKVSTTEEQLMAAMNKAFSSNTNSLNQLQAKKDYSGVGFTSHKNALTKKKKGLTSVSPSKKTSSK